MPGPIVPAPTTAILSISRAAIVSPRSLGVITRSARGDGVMVRCAPGDRGRGRDLPSFSVSPYDPSPCHPATLVSMHADTAPDVDRRAIDECRVVRDEEDDQPVDVLRFLEAPDRRVTQHEVEVALWECRAGAGRLQERRRDVNTGDAARA